MDQSIPQPIARSAGVVRRLFGRLLVVAGGIAALWTHALLADETVFQNSNGGYQGTRSATLSGEFDSQMTENLWGNPTLSVAGVPWGGYRRMGLIRFDNLVGEGAGQLTKGANIVSARLELYKVGEPLDNGQYEKEEPSSRFIHLHRMLTQFYPGGSTEREGTNVSCFSYRIFNDSNPVFWGDQHRLENGPVSGVDYDQVAMAKIPLEPGTLEQWYSFDVTSVVQQWVNGDVKNEGFYLRALGYWIGAYFASGVHPDGALRPKLVVEWTK